VVLLCKVVDAIRAAMPNLEAKGELLGLAKGMLRRRSTVAEAVAEISRSVSLFHLYRLGVPVLLSEAFRLLKLPFGF
jgi:hypothetical protein